MADATCCTGNAVLSYGAALYVGDPAVTAGTPSWFCVGGLVDFSGPDTSRAEIDVTTLCSTAKEYVMDLKDNGSLSLTLQTRLGNAGQKILMENLDSEDYLNFKLVLPDDGYGNGEVVMEFRGSVQSFPIQGSQGAVLTSTVTLRISGDVTTTMPTVRKTVTISPTVLTEDEANNGAVTGTVAVTLTGETFAGTVNGDVPGVSFSGTPDGLTASCRKTGDATAIIAFAGTATTHDSGTTAQVSVTFTDASFTGGSAADVTNATGLSVTINFI